MLPHMIHGSMAQLYDEALLADAVPGAPAGPQPPRSSAKDMLQEASTDLAHILTHRLGGVVSTIEGYADLLIDTLDPEEQRDIALRIIESTAHIERILSDLKRYSQPAVPVLQSVQAGQAAREVAALLDEEAAHRLQLEVQPDLPRVQADPMLLRQALLVLLRNAFDVSGAAVRLRIWADEAAKKLHFAVWNEGSIDRETAERIFAPFFTTKAQNLGIGLPLARRIAEAHRGILRLIANSPTEGTVFDLCLPVHGSP